MANGLWYCRGWTSKVGTALKFEPFSADHKPGHNRRDLSGIQFHKLLVIRAVGHVRYNGKKTRLVYEVLCDCGNLALMRGNDLVTKKILSCGCYKREQTIVFNKRTKTKAAHCTFTSVWQSYKKGAKDRNYEFKLTHEEFYDLTQDDCFYCGLEPLQERQPRDKSKLNSYFYNGVDRVDNSRGYTIDNVVSCCKICNRLKHTLTVEEWMQHMERILLHMKNKRKNKVDNKSTIT